MSKERPHRVVDFPEDLTDTFESDAVTDDIARNFPGVKVVKDTQSRLLHIFGDDQRQVENTEFALRNFISEACIQKIYADAENDAPGRVFPKPFSVYADEKIALEMKLKDTAPDITEEEIKINFEWMNAEAIVCPQDSITGFLTGTIYAKFKDVSECAKIKTTLVGFYPSYDIRFVSSDEWKKIYTTSKYVNGKISEQPHLPNQKTDNVRRDTRSRQNISQSRECDAVSKGPMVNENSRINNKNGKSIRAPVIQADSPYGGSKNSSSASSSRSPYYAQKPDNTLIPPQVLAIKRKRPVAIDANNVCMHHGNHEVYSCLGLEIAVRYFIERGHDQVYAFIPEPRVRCQAQFQSNPPIERQDILQKLEKERRLTIIPRKKNG